MSAAAAARASAGISAAAAAAISVIPLEGPEDGPPSDIEASVFIHEFSLRRASPGTECLPEVIVASLFQKRENAPPKTPISGVQHLIKLFINPSTTTPTTLKISIWHPLLRVRAGNPDAKITPPQRLPVRRVNARVL
jgi:hypothetical protein